MSDVVLFVFGDGMKTLVIDNGSWTSRGGFAGDKLPKVEFPTVVGDGFYVGNEMKGRRGGTVSRYPIERGKITNWDDMEKTWTHMFKNLGVSAENQPILLSEIPLSERCQREKIAQIMFETFKCPALLVVNQAVLSLISSQRKVGIVVSSGHGVTHTVPVYNAFSITRATLALNHGGKDLTDHLRQILMTNCSVSANTPDREISRIKEEMCYVSLDFEKDWYTSAPKKSFTFSDGTEIIMGKNECILSPESMFQPSLKSTPGIAEMTYKSIMACDVGLRRDLFANVVLSGGSTLFPGFLERMRNDMTALAPSSTIKVVRHPHGKNAAWIGGSMLASSKNFLKMCLSKQHYEECGPPAVQRSFNR